LIAQVVNSDGIFIVIEVTNSISYMSYECDHKQSTSSISSSTVKRYPPVQYKSKIDCVYTYTNKNKYIAN